MLRFASLLLLCSTLVFSQTATSLMQGTVTDTSGAALPNTQVSATLANTDTVFRTVTNATGNYVIPNMRPGQYDISFEHPSFKRAVRTGVLIEVNQSARVDMALQIGEAQESISVSADTTTVDTYTATLNETVDSKRMVDLPLNGRQALQLQTIMPGVVPALQGQAASLIAVNTYLTFSVNGTRPSGSFYALDGAVNMDMYNNTPAAFPNPDALQEFSMLTNSYTAVYGGDAGAVVNAVTKAGNNTYHGALYEFLRNTDLNTRNFSLRRGRRCTRISSAPIWAVRSFTTRHSFSDPTRGTGKCRQPLRRVTSCRRRSSGRATSPNRSCQPVRFAMRPVLPTRGTSFRRVN